MFPKIKKEVGKFFLSEEGSISKKNIIKIGVILVGASLANVGKTLGAVNCDEMKSCNVTCDDLFPNDETDISIWLGNSRLDFQQGTESDAGWGDHECHVWSDPRTKNPGYWGVDLTKRVIPWNVEGNAENHKGIIFSADEGWYGHSNDDHCKYAGGATRTADCKIYMVKTQCFGGFLTNSVNVNNIDGQKIKISHQNDITPKNDWLSGSSQSLCGNMHNNVD